MGMRPIVVDGGNEKKELVSKLGAEHFVDFKEEKDVVAKVKEITDGVGAHGVLVTAYQSYKGTSELSAQSVNLLTISQTPSLSAALVRALESCASHFHQLDKSPSVTSRQNSFSTTCISSAHWLVQCKTPRHALSMRNAASSNQSLRFEDYRNGKRVSSSSRRVRSLGA